MQANNPVLEAISRAAKEIAAERQRLNDTFLGLKNTVKAYDPNANLGDDGNIYNDVAPSPALQQSVAERSAADIAQARHMDLEKAGVDALREHEHQAAMSDPRFAEAAQKERERAVRERVKKLIVNRLGSETHAGKWYDAKQVASMLKEPLPLVAEACASLSGGPMERRGNVKAYNGVEYRFPITSPAQSKTPGEPEPPATKQSPTKPPATKPPSGSSPATKSTKTSQPSGGYGIARAPKPFEEMNSAQREGEEKLAKFVEWLKDYKETPPWVGGDIAEDAPWPYPQSWYATALRTLEARGIVQSAGTKLSRTVIRARAANAGTKRAGQGRSSNAYTLAPLDGTQSSGEPSSTTQPATEPQKLTSAEVKVRDWFVKRKVGEVFSPGKVAAEVELDRDNIVLPILRKFAERGSLIDESPSVDMPLFSYVKPKSPGKAAQTDAKKRSTTTTSAGGSAPVAGTGRGQRATDKEIQALLDAVKSAGGTYEASGDGHWWLKVGKARLKIPNTPDKQGTITRLRREVRKLIAENAPITA